MFFGTIYTLPNVKWVAVMRLHVSACDHTMAETILRKLLGYLIGGTNDGEGRRIEKEIGSK
ncbi:unnamed protein product [Prunus armeniaca]|uniref:Uncharacterized protein n=1 Tax=Prunus armeniaca TaxID=36596 RepID=A0A6J5VGU6_PRUAR|nr:unnamed protein product [Prunus armeniaca]